jgi:hypothetical protein
VHQAGAELLEELLLQEHVGELPAESLRRHRGASGRPRAANELHTRPDAPHEEQDRHDDDGREGRGG